MTIDFTRHGKGWCATVTGYGRTQKIARASAMWYAMPDPKHQLDTPWVLIVSGSAAVHHVFGPFSSKNDAELALSRFAENHGDNYVFDMVKMERADMPVTRVTGTSGKGR